MYMPARQMNQRAAVNADEHQGRKRTEKGGVKSKIYREKKDLRPNNRGRVEVTSIYTNLEFSIVTWPYPPVSRLMPLWVNRLPEISRVFFPGKWRAERRSLLI